MQFTLDRDAIVITENAYDSYSSKTSAMVFDINSLEKITEIEVQLYDPDIDSRFNLQYLYEWDNSPN